MSLTVETNPSKSCWGIPNMVVNTLGAGVNVAINSGITFQVYRGINQFLGSNQPTAIQAPGFFDRFRSAPVTPTQTLPPASELLHTIAILTSTGYVTKKITSECLSRLLGCTEETTWRNAATEVISTVSGIAFPILVCNGLGLAIDPRLLLTFGATQVISDLSKGMISSFTKKPHVIAPVVAPVIEEDLFEEESSSEVETSTGTTLADGIQRLNQVMADQWKQTTNDETDADLEDLKKKNPLLHELFTEQS